jgi:tetratricopeptide (TPR) repeat protein
LSDSDPEWIVHEEAAERLKEEGKYEEAIREFLVALEKGSDPSWTWLDIGDCLEKLGRWEEALEAFDKAVAHRGKWWAYTRKAHFLSRYRGLEAAVFWLESLAKAHPTDLQYPYLTGSFLAEAREYRKAIPYYERAIEIANTKHRFQFDNEGWLVLSETTLGKRNDYCDLWPTLEEVAKCCYNVKDYNAAFRYATMGVAIGQQIERCKGWRNEAQVEAGDADCRLVRARVLITRRQWTEAEREIEHAKNCAEDASRNRIERLENWMKRKKEGIKDESGSNQRQ